MKRILGTILAAMIFVSALANEPRPKHGKMSRREKKEMKQAERAKRKEAVMHSKANVKYHKRREDFDKENVIEHPKSERGTINAKRKLDYDKEKV